MSKRNAIRKSINASNDEYWGGGNVAVLKEDMAVSVWTAEATHTGDFMGQRGTGQKITFSGACTGRFKDGKLMEEWSHPDMYALMCQVGLLPEPAPA